MAGKMRCRSLLVAFSAGCGALLAFAPGNRLLGLCVALRLCVYTGALGLRHDHWFLAWASSPRISGLDRLIVHNHLGCPYVLALIQTHGCAFSLVQVLGSNSRVIMPSTKVPASGWVSCSAAISRRFLGQHRTITNSCQHRHKRQSSFLVCSLRAIEEQEIRPPGTACQPVSDLP